MSNLRIIKSYTTSERARLELIQAVYRDAMESSELPVQLRMEKKKPVYKADNRAFVSETWIGQMGHGVLRPQCEALVTKMCEYQKTRADRWFQPEYADDPYNLFLEELKEWLTLRVSVIDCNREAQKMLRQRVYYLEYVLAEPGLFDPFPVHKVTMQQVVFYARRIILYEMLPTVEAEIAHRSAREDLRELQLQVQSALGHVIKFLYNVFRNGGGPVTITPSDLRNPSGTKLEQILTNRSGFLLHKLLASGIFTSVFKDDHFQLVDEQRLVEDGMANGRTETVNFNDFLDARGNVKIPTWLLDYIKDPEERAATDLTNLFDHDDSGWDPFFRKNAMITGCFLRAHGLAQEMAKFILVAQQAHRLAGQGGDLLVYGVANAQVNSMLLTYDNLSKSVRALVDRLNQIAEIHFERLVNENQARDAASSWVKHFKKVAFTIQLLTEDLDRADDAALHVRKQANSLTLNERLQKAKSETENFVTQAEGFSRHVSGVLGMEYQPPAMPRIQTLQDAMTADDLPFGRTLSYSSQGTVSRPALPAPTASFPAFGGSASPLGIEAAPSNPLSGILSPSTRLVQSPSGRTVREDEEIIMVKQNIGDDSINRVFIRMTQATKKVSLENNHVSGSGALSLFEHATKYCPHLQVMNLYNNNLGPDGARALAALMTRPNFSLTRLDLNSNDIGDEGAQYIIFGLLANRTLTQLDLGYNDLTDRGITDLRDALTAPDASLKFLMLSGNNFTSASLTPLLEAFERTPSLIEVDIGDPTDKVPASLSERFKAVAHPRKHVWHEAIKKQYEEEQAKVAEPKLKKIEAPKDGPSLKTTKRASGQYATASPSSPASSSPTPARVKSPSSGPTIEELPDDGPIPSVATQDAWVEEPDVELTKTDYYPLIRIIKILLPVCRTKQYGCVSKKTIRKAFEAGAYGIKLPVVTMTFEEYYEAARLAGVVELREIKKKGSPSKIGLALSEEWRNYVVPTPENMTKVTTKVWHLFIVACKAKPNASHKKSSLLKWARTVKVELQKEAEDVVLAAIELAIYSGVLIMDSGKYSPNLPQKHYPIDLTVCPPFEL